MNILSIASEMAPYAKTGGLADVLSSLPKHLHAAGHDIRPFLPLYDRIDTSRADFKVVIDNIDFRLGSHSYHTKIVMSGSAPQVFFVYCPALYSRGSIYTGDADEHRRFLALCWAALTACQRMGFAPDVVHCHDWQAGMAPLMLRASFAWDRLFARAKTLLTIHNLHYQGTFPAAVLPDLNLGGSTHLLHQDQLKEGRINFMLHGILFADGVSTVSPTYAREIQTESQGAGLDSFLRARTTTVVGILNGVDYEEWSPELDTLIPHHFSADDLSGKERNKEALVSRLGLPYVAGVPVLGIVSRMAGQKGFNLVGEVLPDLLRRHGFQLVALGSGEGRLEDMFAWMQATFPRQVVFYRGFSNALAHLIEAGSDMFLMPSVYEPCGLNQMYSLRYGTVPIVHKTGGLADTVHTWSPSTGQGNGFAFDHHDAGGLRWAIEAALATYRDKAAWRRIMLNGMGEDFSWDHQVKLYELVYSRLTAAR